VLYSPVGVCLVGGGCSCGLLVVRGGLGELGMKWVGGVWRWALGTRGVGLGIGGIRFGVGSIRLGIRGFLGG
jgi:hypothetical protein